MRKLFRKKIVAQSTYEPNERQPCPHCGQNDWREEKLTQFRTINPNGEYVEGYGHAIVQKAEVVGVLYWCVSCGWLEGGNPKIIDPRSNNGH